ncbi:MAG: hypothetical protein JW809_09820 [Pirellulales bacterium]|nr:hypothetical protein [Pirellulales bacterium]
MPRLLAIEWNDVEVRAVVASGRGGRMTVEQAFTVSLLPGAPGGEGGQIDVGRRIAAALAARGIGRLDTLVAAGRADVELRQLAVPPCPADELPDVVRFQAVKEFNALKEDWPLDFIPLGGDPPQNVLAAAADPAWVGEIQGILDAAGLKPQRLVLRPCATASLWRRGEAAAGAEVCLLVDLLGAEAELTVLFDRREFFLRSARLPADPAGDADARAALAAEIRRTMVAVQNQLGGHRVESIVLVAAGESHGETASQLRQELGTAVELFDPLSRVPLAGEARRTLPEQAGQFAALLGMAWDELDRTAPAIDFLHPRRRREPQGRRNALAVAGLAVALLFLGGVGYGWWAKQDLIDRTRQLSGELRTLEPKVAEADRIQRAAADVQDWVDNDVVWLDELRWLGDNLPPAEDAMLTQLQIRPNRTGGQIDLQGFIRSVDAIKAMERDLRDDRHNVEGRDKSDDRSQKPYTLWFRSSVVIQRKEP